MQGNLGQDPMMNEKQPADDSVAAFREVVSILEKNGRYLEVVGLKTTTREAYRKTVAYLKRMDVDEIENLLRGKKRDHGTRKRLLDPDVSDDEMRSLSPDRVRQFAESEEVSRKFLERLAKLRFGMTSGAISVHGSRAALVEKINTLLGHEGTHQAITRAIVSDNVTQGSDAATQGEVTPSRQE